MQQPGPDIPPSYYLDLVHRDIKSGTRSDSWMTGATRARSAFMADPVGWAFFSHSNVEQLLRNIALENKTNHLVDLAFVAPIMLDVFVYKQWTAAYGELTSTQVTLQVHSANAMVQERVLQRYTSSVSGSSKYAALMLRGDTPRFRHSIPVTTTERTSVLSQPNPLCTQGGFFDTSVSNVVPQGQTAPLFADYPEKALSGVRRSYD